MNAILTVPLKSSYKTMIFFKNRLRESFQHELLWMKEGRKHGIEHLTQHIWVTRTVEMKRIKRMRMKN